MLDILFPKKDILSNNFGNYINSRKLKTHDEICYKCLKKSKNFKTHKYCNKNIYQIVTCFYYTKEIKKYIINFKYYHRKEYKNELSNLLYYFFEIYLGYLDKNKSIITYVPMHWFRKFFIKGYNQSEELAALLGEKINIKVINICKKNKYTKPQAKVKYRKERMKNIKNSFKINNLKLEKNIENIIIVDDIITSGSTIEEISECIKSKYPNIKIYCIVLARK